MGEKTDKLEVFNILEHFRNFSCQFSSVLWKCKLLSLGLLKISYITIDIAKKIVASVANYFWCYTKSS